MSKPTPMPKLCIVSSYEFSDTNATKARLTAYIDILSQYFDITFLCPNGGDIPVTDRVKICNIGRAPARGRFFVRAFRELTYAFQAWRIMSSLNADVALISSPSMFLLGLSIWKKCPIIFDIRDLTWEYLPEVSFFQRLIKSMFRLFTIAMLAKSDMVFVTNLHEYKYIEKILKSRKVSIPIEIVRNGISRQRYTRLRSLIDSRESSNPMLLYIGNVGLAQDLTTLIDAIIHQPNLTVKVIGNGTDLERIQQYAGEKQVKNIEFVRGVSWGKLGEYYAQADILYAQITSEYESAIPSKLYEYLTLGVPIIYGGRGAAAEFAMGFDSIEVIEPSNSNMLSAALERAKKMIGNPRGSNNAKNIRANYLRENQVEKIVPIICLMVNCQYGPSSENYGKEGWSWDRKR